jgi:hypothetical protein
LGASLKLPTVTWEQLAEDITECDPLGKAVAPSYLKSLARKEEYGKGGATPTAPRRSVSPEKAWELGEKLAAVPDREWCTGLLSLAAAQYHEHVLGFVGALISDKRSANDFFRDGLADDANSSLVQYHERRATRLTLSGVPKEENLSAILAESLAKPLHVSGWDALIGMDYEARDFLVDIATRPDSFVDPMPLRPRWVPNERQRRIMNKVWDRWIAAETLSSFPSLIAAAIDFTGSLDGADCVASARELVYAVRYELYFKVLGILRRWLRAGPEERAILESSFYHENEKLWSSIQTANPNAYEQQTARRVRLSTTHYRGPREENYQAEKPFNVQIAEEHRLQRLIADKATQQLAAPNLNSELDEARESWLSGLISDDEYRYFADDPFKPRRTFAVLYARAMRQHDGKRPSDTEWGLFVATANGTQSIDDLAEQIVSRDQEPATDLV